MRHFNCSTHPDVSGVEFFATIDKWIDTLSILEHSFSPVPVVNVRYSGIDLSFMLKYVFFKSIEPPFIDKHN